MKVVVRLLILFICFITIQSEAQRGWRLFDQFGAVYAIHESRDGTLWVGADSGSGMLFVTGSGMQILVRALFWQVGEQ